MFKSRDCYYDKWGPGYFYEQQDAFDAYDARLSAILNHKGATSGKVWKEWDEAILSFNLQVRFPLADLPGTSIFRLTRTDE